MRFVIVTMGSEGDVRPYIALARELKLIGHEVSLATSDNHNRLFSGTDIDYVPMGQYYGDPPTLFRFRFVKAVYSAIENKTGYLQELWKVCQEADALIYNVATYPVFYIAQKLGIPSFGAFVQPHHATGAFPHPIVTNGKPLGNLFNKAQFWLFSALHWWHVRESINQWRKVTLDLPPLSRRDTLLRQLKENKPRILYAYSPALVPKPTDWDWHNIEVTGYWYSDTGKEYTPPPELDRFLNNGPAPVFISILWNRDKFDKETLIALSQMLDCRLLIQDLHGQLDGMDFTDTIGYVRGPVPHEWLFKRISVAVHHGGLGISMNCIRAGVPMVAIPAVGVNDHRFWVYLVSRSGIGIHLPASGKSKAFPRRLASAITKVLNSRKMKMRIDEMSKQVKTETGVQNAVRIISDALV